MNKTIFYILITSLILSCKTDSKKLNLNENSDNSDIEVVADDKKNIKADQTTDLKALIRSLKIDSLNFNDLYNEVEKTTYLNPLIDRKSERWIYDLEKKDSVNFEQAHNLYPKCKLFENEHIVSVVFADLYDYKTALHLFTFKKPDLKPKSSFILYLLGGDGEDFWNIKLTPLGILKYKLSEEYGYDNNSVKKDEYLIKLREDREYVIDSTNGELTKKIINIKKDFKEIRK